jgi:hypothetical protein
VSARFKVTLIVGACLALAFSILLPALLRPPAYGQRHYCINNLRQLEGAKQLWAEENHKTTNDTPAVEDIRPFIAPHALVCPQGGTYTLGRIGELPRCSRGGPGHTLP